MTDTQATKAPWPLARIGIDGSCYTADDTGLAVDLHGWQSDHPIFAEVFQKHRPKLVCEIGFEGIAQSPRHKSGIAVRFPRILRLRDDKRVEDADTLEQLRTLAGALS